MKARVLPGFARRGAKPYYVVRESTPILDKGDGMPLDRESKFFFGAWKIVNEVIVERKI